MSHVFAAIILRFLHPFVNKDISSQNISCNEFNYGMKKLEYNESNDKKIMSFVVTYSTSNYTNRRQTKSTDFSLF